MLIGIASIRHETNTFSTLRADLSEFEVQRGDAVTASPFWERYRADGITLCPTLIARAPPHGLVTAAAYRTLSDDLLRRLSALPPLDGLFLDLHGAMEVEGVGDGESALVLAIRACVGPNLPIAASLDLHANLAPAVVSAIDVLTAFRTAPHRDADETRHRALGHLIAAVRTGRRPVTAMVKPPLLIPGENAVTDIEPARSLYGMLPEIERRPGVLDASVIIGCAWTDSAYTSTAALVVADDSTIAKREARALAGAIWEQRAAFRAEAETADVDDAVGRALSAADAPVFISDSGDNVTAGGAGDLPLLLGALIHAHATGSLVAGIADADAVAACIAAGTGGRTQLSIGGKLDRINGMPLRREAWVLRLAPGLAFVRVAGVDAILAVDRRAFTTLADFGAIGVDPLDYHVVVVKQGYLFPELRAVARRAILALSPGFTDLRLDRLPFRRVLRPIYPLDGDFAWSPSD